MPSVSQAVESHADGYEVTPQILFDKVYRYREGILSLASEQTAYSLKNSLFSDYSFKMRGIYIPQNKAIIVQDNGKFSYPEGAILSKVFYYPLVKDAHCEEDNKTLMRVNLEYQGNDKPVSEIVLRRYCLLDLRILYKSKDGWLPFVYTWSASRQAAVYSPAGNEYLLKGYLEAEEKMFRYSVPTRNQCYSCHQGGRNTENFEPLGPGLKRLNFDIFLAPGKKKNQLMHWTQQGILSNKRYIPPLYSEVSIRSRIRAYFDINCGHCHNPRGLAASSGLFLDSDETSLGRLGVCKRPVASAERKEVTDVRYDIEPGAPKKSFLYQRLISGDSQIKMPEIGRHLTDIRAIKLVDEWIHSLNVECEI